MKEGQNQRFVPKVDSAPEMTNEDPRLSFQDLVSATVEPGDGVLSKLWSHLSLLPKKQSQEIDELLMELELRIRRYLITEEKNDKKKQQPTVYTQLLVDAVNSEGEISQSVQRALVELSSTVVAEITPILRRVHSVIAEIAPSLANMQTIQNLSTNEGLLNALAQGSTGRKDAPSFFGILQSLKEKVNDFPSINLSETTIPQRLIIEDPLSVDTVGYFKERQDIFASIYDRKISLPQLLASRSLSEAYELDITAQHIAKDVKRDVAQLKDVEDDTQREKLQTEIDWKKDLRRAYATLAQWVNTEAENLEGMNDTSFQSHVASLTFAWGNPDEITDILNSLETIKHDNPELYARMLGIQAQASSSEAQRSDLFGNALHIAFHHSFHTRTTSDIQGSQFFHDRMVKLTELDATQDALVHINERQWHKLEKLLVPQASGIAQGSVTELWKAKQYSEFFQSYQLRKMLEATDIERMEELLEQLRTSTPTEFVRLMRSRRLLPKSLAWYEDHEFPKDIAAIFRERGVRVDDESDKLKVVVALESGHTPLKTSWMTMPRIAGQMRPEVIYALNDSKKNWDAIATELWKTTPSEKLLEREEFMRRLITTTDTVQRARSDLTRLKDPKRRDPATLQEYREIEEDARSRMENAVSNFCSILSAHPDITKERWLEWYERYLKSRITGVSQMTFVLEKRDRTTINLEFLVVVKGLFSEFHPRHVIEHPSGFFALAETLFPLKYLSNKSPLLAHFPRLANHTSEILTIDNELREPHVKLLVHYRTTDTKTFLMRHGNEFNTVDLDAFFSLLTPEESVDFLETLFSQERRQPFSPVELFAEHWKPHAAYARTQSPPLSKEFFEKYSETFSFELLWLAKILNYAERYISNAPTYSSLTDFGIDDKYLSEKYRCCKIQNKKGDSIWIIERRDKPLEAWYQVH